MISAALAILESEEQRNELSELYEQNIKKFYSIAYSKLHNRQDAEDVIQEVFSDIADKPEIFFNIPKSERVTFVDILIRNTAISAFKKEHNRIDKLQELDEEMVDESVRIEDDILAKVARNELIKYILTLPEQQRTVYKLRVITGLSISEIAEQLKISRETVNWHLKMLRKNIRKFIEKGINGNE